MLTLDNLRMAVSYARVFSDYSSIREWRAAMHPQAEHAEYHFRVRPLHGRSVVCRAGTSDLNVFYDAFFCQYHLAPRGLRPKTILDLGSNIGLTMAHYAALFP